MSKIATVWNGERWEKKSDYKTTCNCYRYGGRVLWIDPKVWKLPTFNISENSPFTGSKIEGHGKTIQVRFTVSSKNEALKNYVRRYILGVARENDVAGTKAAMFLNLQRVGSNFIFQSSFCGSDSPIAGFLRALKEFDGEAFKTIYFRYRDETGSISKISKWYKVRFESEEAFGGVVRLVRDEGDKGYTDFTDKYKVTHQGIYKVLLK